MSLGQLGTLLSNVSQLSPADADIIETTDPSSNLSGISSSGTTEHATESPAAEDSNSENAYDVWVSAILSSVQSQLNSSSTHGSSSSSTKLPTSTAITQLVWGVSEMRIDPGGPLLAELWAILEPQLQDLLGSDLATLTCGLGIIVVETGRPLQPPQPPASSSASPAEQLQQHRQRWVQVSDSVSRAGPLDTCFRLAFLEPHRCVHLCRTTIDIHTYVYMTQTAHM